MNKGIWKFFTFAGFFLAVVAAGMILVFRFQFLDRIALFSRSLDGDASLARQQTGNLTQMVTQQTDFPGQDLDHKNLQRLSQSCFSGNDCVSSIDEPQFVSARQASKFLKDDDMVIGVAFENWQHEDDPVKAYPVKILNWHEVVNDFVNEIPVAVTYSPLSMTHRVFETMDGGTVDPLGVSGMVLNSGVVLYDRETKSLWNQFDGMALTGSKRDQKLKLYPSVFVRWADWVREHPTTSVLSMKTGFAYNYNEYPYGDYPQSPDVYYPLEHTDDRRKPKDLVYGIVDGDHVKVYPETELFKALSGKETVSDEFSGIKLELSFIGRSFKAVDARTHEEVPALSGYYFIWEAFHPGVEIYQAPPVSPK